MKSVHAFCFFALAALLIGVLDLGHSRAAYIPPAPVGSNVGDASPTLTVGVSSPIQIFSSSLTQNRTITLSNTNVYAGASFTIVRSGAGVGTLNIGNVVTLATLVPAWATITYNGSSWVETAYGLLTP